MRVFKLMFYVLLLAGFACCGASGNSDAAADSIGRNSMTEETHTVNTENINLINLVYRKFVFAIDSDGYEINNPEKYFTSNALKKLMDDYTFDCDNGYCYAYYALRTEAQDSKPESDDVSIIYSIDMSENGWYLVSYSDMGWFGKTRIRIVDGKIDDYERIESSYSKKL
ncbi:hypothetical protein [uncultured Muribaculum sp.]|uniref:hypothetical protein n=1 Tax=uncultured Muribaculum sp. TaxID=1918613 RepID=UPI0025AFA70D|nr:hypothetical protein [uncultured Muribaculum sp.]